MKRASLSVALLVLLLSGCGAAPTAPKGADDARTTAQSVATVTKAVKAYFQAKFDMLDVDHSGLVTKAEAISVGLDPEGFDAYDADGNGTLTLGEFAPPHAIEAIVTTIRQTAAAEFKRMDVNGDRALSAEEMAQAVALPFAMCDANRDGKVTASEFENAFALVTTKGTSR
ncbi:hypothetical protein J7643_15535 [bacterium]|nr:hypothetical protein [bacterium]